MLQAYPGQASFEIPATVGLGEAELVLYAVFEVIQNESTDWRFGANITVHNEHLHRIIFVSSSIKTTATHLWIKLIPLRTGTDVHILESQQAGLNECVATFYFTQDMQPVRLKSCNARLLTVSDQDDIDSGMEVGYNYEHQEKASLFMNINNTNVGHDQETSLLMEQDDTNVHQEKAYPQKRKTFEEPTHPRKKKHEEQPSISTSPMISPATFS